MPNVSAEVQAKANVHCSYEKEARDISATRKAQQRSFEPILLVPAPKFLSNKYLDAKKILKIVLS